MKRLCEFVQSSRSSGDWHALGLLLIVGLIGFWLLCMPISATVQNATINRFHLATPQFWQWIAQQPIPPMYNLENRYWFSERQLTPDDLTDQPSSDVETGVLNHFPARAVTFASGRMLTLKHRRDGWLYLHSRYGESQRITTYRLSSVKGLDGLRMHRVDQVEGDQNFPDNDDDHGTKLATVGRQQ